MSRRVLKVRPDGAGPYKTIQDALDHACDGDVVELAEGVYSGDGNRDIDFLGKSVELGSAGAARSCTIDCGGSKEGPHRAFVFHENEGTSTIVKRITIISGYALSKGGGILCEFSSSPTLQDLSIVNCHAEEHGEGNAEMGGSAVHLIDGSNPVFSKCILSFCSNGQAVDCTGSEPTRVFTCSDIFGNTGGDWEDCIEGQLGIQGNISVDPLYCDPSTGSLYLRPESPGRAESSACGRMGALPGSYD